jgi:hypothetical protein
MTHEANWQPTRKVTMGAIGGVPFAVLIVWALTTYGGVEVPPEVGGAIGAIATCLLSYLVPEGS